MENSQNLIIGEFTFSHELYKGEKVLSVFYINTRLRLIRTSTQVRDGYITLIEKVTKRISDEDKVKISDFAFNNTGKVVVFHEEDDSSCIMLGGKKYYNNENLIEREELNMKNTFFKLNTGSLEGDNFGLFKTSYPMTNEEFLDKANRKVYAVDHLTTLCESLDSYINLIRLSIGEDEAITPIYNCDNNYSQVLLSTVV